MKIVLNLIIASLIFLLACEIQENANSITTNYSDSILIISIVFMFEFFRINSDELLTYLTKKQ